MEKTQSTEDNLSMEKSNQIYQIYDRIFKSIFALSSIAIINLINGLFNIDYPLDSEIHFSNKEFVNKKLTKKFADIFITIHSVTYHIEAQMEKDSRIVLRVFEYGFYNAIENTEDYGILHFAEPMVIYLDSTINIPDKSVLILDFGSQGSFRYEVKNFFIKNMKLKS